MNIPGNGIYVVKGEMSIIVTAMRRANRWSSSHNHQDEEIELLMRGFTELKEELNRISDLKEVEPKYFLNPFLEVIRSEETTGPVTSLALSSVNKFLSYGLVDSSDKNLAETVDAIAEAVCNTRFVGADMATDAVVLMKILQVLRTLMLSPIGFLLTNENVCEIMLSCFRICFETRFSELLRRCAENCLKDLVQLLFTRLPYFSEDLRKSFVLKKLKMRGEMETGKGKKKKMNTAQRKKSREELKSAASDKQQPQAQVESDSSSKPPEKAECPPTAEISHVNEEVPSDTVEKLPELEDEEAALKDQAGSPPVSIQCEVVNEVQEPEMEQKEPDKQEEPLEEKQPEPLDGIVISIEESDVSLEDTAHPPEPPLEECKVEELGSQTVDGPSQEEILVEEKAHVEVPSPEAKDSERINQQGVRFTALEPDPEGKLLAPYGLVCVQELLRFLISLCNPEESQNTEPMLGLTLITVALEVGADSMSKFSSFLSLIKDELCRNIFSLLNTDKLPLFAADLQVAFLLFESLRTHLKFQFERFLARLMEIIVSEKTPYEQKEIALDTVVQLWRIPGLVTELYLNYDCDLYCPNLYEELTKLLSKNAYPVSGVHNTHLLSLDALLTVIDSIESHCNSRILNERQQTNQADIETAQKEMRRYSSRHKISMDIPSHEQLMAIKRKKKLLSIGTEHFNSKPRKGIQFLQEQHLLSTPLDSSEVVSFLRENPHLDKKMIGEYISNRANLSVLECFVHSFDFTEMRIDEALRLYLESFRLPGESPLISLVMEYFADHWHKCNLSPFANSDAAFTLAYAVIMLNVDQHNHNVKKQNNPMTADEFKRNLKNVNGGQDFDQEMLDGIYISIKTDEIVMPAEQTGLVRENYLWKVLLRRGAGRDGIYVNAPTGLLDHDLFSLIWSPTVAALSYLFDKTNEKAVYHQAISGFRKCAMISAHYGMTNDFDNLVVSLCKFTMLHSSSESSDNVTIMFGSNMKALLAAKTVFNLVHRHGDIVRESWRNILDIIIQLYRCKLLPKILVEAEDFIELSGKISLMREEIQLNHKQESGLLSSLYSYIALASETNTQKGPSPEDQEAIRQAQNCIRECQLEQLITESKFLRIDSLQHFVKALIRASYGPEGHVSLGSAYSEDTAVFFLEFLLKVVIQNRDRVQSMWSSVREHIYTLLMGAAACDHHFLVERSIVGLLRLAIRLMRREEMSPIVLQSLRMLLLLKGSTLSRVSRQISYGMYELLKTSAANIHSATDWAIIFTLLECVGAGAPPPRVVGKPSAYSGSGARSEGESVVENGPVNQRGYTSDSELNKVSSPTLSPASSSDVPVNTPAGWILVGREGEIQPVSFGNRVPPPDPNMSDRELMAHDPFAMVKCCESLAFLVRDVAHITPFNFENCVHCIRTFVEACADANEKKHFGKVKEVRLTRKKVSNLRKGKDDRGKSPPGSPYDADESDPEEMPSGYQQVCIQLLDLMHTLHTRTAQIYRWWAEECKEAEHVSLWTDGWCPLLQGIARLCSHSKRQVRMSAITYLQRALLVHDLQTLTGTEWESCFTQVLFPLLQRLLEPIPTQQEGLEETRIRAATVLSKVFLHHLTPLLSLSSFTQLWLTILDFMDKYMHADNSDLLLEAIPESLKNMLLVMDSANVFSTVDDRNEIWTITWDRIDLFLPTLRAELFRSRHPAEEVEGGVEEMPVPELQPSPPILLPPTSAEAEVPTTVSAPVPINVPPLITPHNWQPPAPIFPHMGQLLSTPIGPPVIQVSSQLPLYSGFANSPPKADVPSAQFFYQDLNVIPTSIQVRVQPDGANLPVSEESLISSDQRVITSSMEGTS